MYPKIVINREGIKENTEKIVRRCAELGIKVTGITKSFLADPEIAECLIRGGVSSLGDSRIENLKRLACFNIEKWLIRIPMPCEVADVVRYSDVSLNSELDTVRLLDREARNQGKKHRVILMADLGDLREGYFSLDDMINDIDEILSMENVILYGIGTNLTCYGGIIPGEDNLGRLVDIKNRIEETFGISLAAVSGGNSSSYTLVDEGRMPEGINNLRIGEAIVLGRETSYGTFPEYLRKDNFVIEAQIVEVKEKPSYPIGKIGMDSFGNIPHFEDRGIMKRALVAIGRQDVLPEDLSPLDEGVEILGASSDHMILNVTDAKRQYRTGDIVSFIPAYGALLCAMTSEFIRKEKKDG